MKLPLLVQAIFSSLAVALTYPVTIIHDYEHLESHYDYIVVGGGTSGLTVANRLTEDLKINVLVIEIGALDDGSPGTLVPGLQPPQKYWRTYESVPQPGLNNRSSNLYTAQVVGGGTVINGMFFNRGSSEDYDAWEKLGNPGWGWKDLLPYFKKSETYTPAAEELRAELPISPDLKPHGIHGLVGSSYPPFAFEVIKYAFRAWDSLGIKLNPQSNAGLAVGAFHSPLSLTHGSVSRSSASTAYYKGEPSRRPNFHLLAGHRVHRIVFDGMRACGVEYAPRNGTRAKVMEATSEVIVAAGAQRSPQLLSLSGIGPRKLLLSLSIPVVLDLPGVGYNFHDQPSYYFAVEYKNWSFPTPDWLDLKAGNHIQYAKDALKLYYERRQGPYTLPYQSGSDVAFIPLLNITDKFQEIIKQAKTVDIKDTLPAGIDQTVVHGHEAQRDILLKHYCSDKTAVQEMTFGGTPVIITAYLKPLSRGSILIDSANPEDDPVIDFGTFTHPTDVDIMVAAFKKTRDFIQSTPMQEIGVFEVSPGLNVKTDKEIIKALRNKTLSSWQHPVGTLAMMPRQYGGVVDSELKVYGVKGLRVVDASIMPIIPASHTSSTVYAVAEKAADLIKAHRASQGDHKSQKRPKAAH